MCGASSSSDNLAVSGGNLYVSAGKPGMLFGTVGRSRQNEEFSYLIVFKHANPTLADSRAVDFQCSSDGRQAKTIDKISIKGTAIEADYQIRLNESMNEIESESLAIGGELKDLSRGKIFLIDLTDSAPEFEQIDGVLPQISNELKTTDDIKQLMELIEASLDTLPKAKKYLN